MQIAYKIAEILTFCTKINLIFKTFYLFFKTFINYFALEIDFSFQFLYNLIGDKYAYVFFKHINSIYKPAPRTD